MLTQQPLTQMCNRWNRESITRCCTTTWVRAPSWRFHLILSLFFADQQKDLHFRGTAWKGNLRRLSEVRRQRQHHHLCSNIMQRAGCLGTVNFFGTFTRIDRSIKRRGVCAVAGQFVDFLTGNKWVVVDLQKHGPFIHDPGMFCFRLGIQKSLRREGQLGVQPGALEAVARQHLLLLQVLD